MPAKELRMLTVEELIKKESDLRHELFNLRFQHGTHQLENIMRIRSVRRDIARIQTIINELRS
ncbi:50S ribosomal protein L29 [Dissulfurimicrobium hydrothermale]|nr:50S ribosomal protein L29 [Dissulfurimicrobium hydrothermale]UKL14604.1 50S ribosomal protein L29 [Dissulfurimicrobium hydrothermale]